MRALAMSGAAHCLPSALWPLASRDGSMAASVSALTTSSIGYRMPASADAAKALSFRMSG